jgi:AraC-like DNA-binding protein
MNESDALSEVLRGVRLTGAIFLRGELSEPWGFQAPPAGNASALLAPGTDCLVPFHLVTEGMATVRVKGCEPLRLGAGEIVVLPRGDAHVLQNGAPPELVDTSGLLPKILKGSLLSETGGGDGPVTRFICGYVGCDRQAEKLFLSNLPPVFKVGVRPQGSAGWIESALSHLVGESESSRPGSRALLTKLAEALFIETLRRHMAELRPEDTGWLAAARDPAIGRALWWMHREPTRDWTVAELAKRAGVSRTVFARRFVEVLGQTPLAYLASFRLSVGATRLLSSDDSVLGVAVAVGYESEAAFNRAFKREFGLPPARYRKRERLARERASKTGRTTIASS